MLSADTCMATVAGWVLDYACKYNHHEVIAALYMRYENCISTLDVLDARLSAATIHRVVVCRELDDFNTAVELVNSLYQLLGDAGPFRVFCRLVCGLKMKGLMEELKRRASDTIGLNVMLNKTFPRSPLIDDNASQKDLSRLKVRVSIFRKFFLSLLTNDSLRETYLRDEYELEFGEEFFKSLEKHVNNFLEVVNQYLPMTVIELMLAKGVDDICSHVTSVPVAVDILLECMVNKTEMDSRDLLDLLTLLHPIGPLDRFRPCLQITFTSDDSFSSSNTSDRSSGGMLLDKSQHEVTTVTVAEVNDMDSGSHGNHDFRSSELANSSEESVSILSRRRPAGGARPKEISASADKQMPSADNRTPSADNQTPSADNQTPSADNQTPSADNQTPSQVFVISSSSDSNPSQGLQVKGQMSKELTNLQHYKKTFETPAMADCSVPSGSDSWATVQSTASSHEGLLDVCDVSPNSSFIVSSNYQEIQEYSSSSTPYPMLNYPNLKQYQKEGCIKLCVVKLYRNKSLDVKTKSKTMKMYS